MKLICKHINLALSISEELLETLSNNGHQHYPKEYGGLLVGRYIEDSKTVLIEHTILPKTFTSSKYHFKRGVNGLKEQLSNYYNQEVPLIYVGEWHTHPDNSAVPSSTDFKAMKEIVESPDVYIENPLLIIFNITPLSSHARFYVYFKNKLHEYETV